MPCNEQNMKGDTYSRNCEKKERFNTATHRPISRAPKKLKLIKRNISNSITSMEEVTITSIGGTWARFAILSYEKQFLFCDGLKTRVNLRFQSKYQSTSLQLLAFKAISLF